MGHHSMDHHSMDRHGMDHHSMGQGIPFDNTFLLWAVNDCHLRPKLLKEEHISTLTQPHDFLPPAVISNSVDGGWGGEFRHKMGT